MVKLEFQEKRSMVPALQVRYLIKLDSRRTTKTRRTRWTKRTRISARYNPRSLSVGVGGGLRWTRRRTRKTWRTRWGRRTRICARYNPRWLSVVVGGGRRWTRRRTRKTRRTRWLRICARYNPRWLAVVVGGGWRWLEVVELDEVEDEDSCSFCAPPSYPLVHILRRDIAVLRIKKKRLIKMQIAPLFLPLCFQPLLCRVFKI
ncbi:uncharacterized protein [Neodiprion pinetum]|uniref:uncharacterized protein isoform X1 n=1 Tax=Neodiprion pinetum TaxID=441929 RepID=UPI0037226442